MAPDTGDGQEMAPSHESKRTICGLARQCIKAFQGLRTALEHPDQLHSAFISLPAVDDEIGRFRGWASNLGVMKTDRSSLDFRLRDVSFLFDNVITLLDSLQISLTEVTNVALGTKLIHKEDSPSQEEFELDYSSESSLESDCLGSQPKTGVTEVQQYYQGIVDIIDRLYKLSIIIRSPQLKNHPTKAEIYIERDSEGRDISAEFEQYAITRALYQMCTWKNKNDPVNLTNDEKALATRLGKANSRRRRQFMYDQRHHLKLASLEPNAEEEEDLNIQALNFSKMSQDPEKGVSNVPPGFANSRDTFSSVKYPTILSETTATKYTAPPQQLQDNRSTTSGSTSYSGYQMSDISIPAAPQDKLQKEFECPYCYMILPAKTRRTDAWRKHVMRDLRPYICLYNLCPAQDILYDSKTAWLKHEQWEHAYQWCCDSADHALVMFPAADEFKIHMRTAHSETFQEYQLDGLADASKRPSLIAFEQCPLCGITPEDISNPQTPRCAYVPEEKSHEARFSIRRDDDKFIISRAAEDLQKHVARHLCHSAMIALPGREDLDEAKSISNTRSLIAKSDTFDIFDNPIDKIVSCRFVEAFQQPKDLPVSDNDLLWENVFISVGVRLGEDLGLDKVLSFAWPRYSSEVEKVTRHKMIHQLLSSPDPTIDHNHARGLYQPTTGQWFLEGDQFKKWESAPKSFYCLYGIPGCGKTILCSTIIEHVKSQHESYPSVAVAYFYFSYRDTEKIQLESLLTSLIKQLAGQSMVSAANLELLYEGTNNSQRKLTLYELEQTLRLMLEEVEESFIIIDALDECFQRQELLDFLANLVSWEIVNLHVLATSRSEIDIEVNLSPLTTGQLSTQDWDIYADIELYLHARVEGDIKLRRWCADIGVQLNIEAYILTNADDLFRSVECQLEAIKGCFDLSEVSNVLRSFPPTLEETYERILCGIDSEHQEYVIKILPWLVYALRPLKVNEVAEILAIDQDNLNINILNRLPDLNDILAMCSSLIVTTHSIELSDGDDYYDEVLVAHSSVTKYLLSPQIEMGPASQYKISNRANGSIAEACLIYLLHLGSIPLTSNTVNEYPLARYVAKYWTHHARVATANEDPPVSVDRVNELIQRLFKSDGDAYITWIRIHDLDDSREYIDLEKSLEDVPSPLYYASIEGLIKPVEALIGSGLNVDVRGGHYGSALQASSARGHKEITQLLLEHGADINIQGGYYSTALYASSARCHKEITQLLLEYGADINIQGGHYSTALQASSAHGYKEITQLLLEHGADVDIQGGYYGTALQASIANRHKEITQLLLEHGADVNIQGGHYGTALQASSVRGDKEITQFLLEHGADVNIQGGEYGTALQASIAYGHKEITQLLLDHGAKWPEEPRDG